jgi:hypothetical protein
MTKTALQKLTENIIIDDDGCWLWQGYLNRGYGKIKINDKWHRVHRFSYEFYNNVKVSNDFDVDHSCHSDNPLECGQAICKHRSCINPDHLQALDKKTHSNKGKHTLERRCGHPRTPQNTYKYKQYSWCRICKSKQTSKAKEVRI